jgi:C-terminal processing protease CtpA/Prc
LQGKRKDFERLVRLEVVRHLCDGGSVVREIAMSTVVAAVEERLDSPTFDPSGLAGVMTLPEFLGLAGELDPGERALITDQARVLIEDLYVHLPLKRAMHAVDPIQRLRLLRYRLERLSEPRFHDELIRIFTGLRDLHTNYILPEPYQSRTAFLPFMIEEFWEGDTRRFVVSRTFDGFAHPTFAAGVVLTYWNGVPVERAVELNADRQAGSNEDARLARGIEAMTIRPLAQSAPPDEHWAVVGYRDGDEERSLLIEWRVFEPGPSPEGVDPTDADRPAARSLGIDAKTEAVRRAKKTLFAAKAMAAELEAVRGAADVDLSTTSSMPDVFAFRAVETARGTLGYVRIWTFNVEDADAFVQEFVRIAGLLPTTGLIVDVRGNGGGLITAGERLLQVLTPRTIEPERLHFINTPLTARLARDVPWLEQWRESIEQAVETGATFSLGFPIDDAEEANRLGQQYHGPVLLITDALCYSTTDIFAAGFQDHEVGPILGTSGNTGAGGANVWTHDLLRQLLPGPGSPLEQLPSGTSFRVSIRRTTRVGERSGVPVEDLGVVPNEVHRMTKADVLEGNRDLIERAAELLAELPRYGLVVTTKAENGKVAVKVEAENLTRLDATVNGRPLASLDVEDGEASFEVPGAADGRVLEVKGFDGDRFAACRRIAL